MAGEILTKLMRILLNDYVTIAIFIVIFILLFVGMYYLFHSLRLIEATKRNVEQLYIRLHQKDETRITRNERLNKNIYNPSVKIGTLQKLLMRIDDTIVYSEIKGKFKWLDTSVFIMITVVLASSALLLMLTVAKNLVGAITIAAITAFTPYVILKQKALKNYHRVENQLTTFADMLSNYSATTNSLITLLEDTAEYMEAPISTAIYRAIATVNITGSNEKGISQLTREIEHPLFVKLIRNLDLCSRNDANYHKIAMDFSEQIDKDLKYMERSRAILASGRNQLLLLWILIVAAVVVATYLFGMNIFALIADMSHSALGMVCLIAELILNGSTILFLIIGLNK